MQAPGEREQKTRAQALLTELMEVWKASGAEAEPPTTRALLLIQVVDVALFDLNHQIRAITNKVGDSNFEDLSRARSRIEAARKSLNCTAKGHPPARHNE